MDFFYINLAERTDRRNFLERNFHANNSSRWSISRVEATSAQSIAGNRVAGHLRDAQKACFLSHVKAIAAAKQAGGHAFIAEDDILFGKFSTASVDCALMSIPEHAWDIIYTDLMVTSVDKMIEFFKLRRKLSMVGQHRLIDLGHLPFPFAGSTAYIVNRNAMGKIMDMLPCDGPIELSYDLYLRQLVHGGNLRAFVTFPFATTVSNFADASQIQPSHEEVTDLVWNAFRRLTWQERDINSAMAFLSGVGAGTNDPDSAAFSKLLCVMLTPQYKSK